MEKRLRGLLDQAASQHSRNQGRQIVRRWQAKAWTLLILCILACLLSIYYLWRPWRFLAMAGIAAVFAFGMYLLVRGYNRLIVSLVCDQCDPSLALGVMREADRGPLLGLFVNRNVETVAAVLNCMMLEGREDEARQAMKELELHSRAWDYRRTVLLCDYHFMKKDSMEIDKQHALIRELELPVACLVHSGKKSLHAIVKVDAADYGEYRKRVDYLYDICRKNGLEIDQQNRNPSRLSRMPGVLRGENKQFLIDTNIGKESWAEWKEWIESVNDDLPDPESLEDVWDNLPELAPCLIEGVLRQGHKMLIAGPSKAGKSFLQIEMCIAIAEGRKWLSWQCSQGRVMYVNLELDRASCLHRFRDVYQAMGIHPEHLDNIDIWNLRGKSRPMDKLAPMLIRRASKKNYIAIIIDPIYKVITGDENSADQMSNFCNQFDKVCTELGVAVIYCHHHSKGSQGSKKSMDRASGSGVFARDPDAMLDMIELELSEDALKQEENKAVCEACKQYLDSHFKWDDDLSQDDLCSSYQMLNYCENKLDVWQWANLQKMVEVARIRARSVTAWRIEGTLREFPKFPAVNAWFNYPVHTIDQVGILSDIQPETEKPLWQKAVEKRKELAQKAKEKKLSSFEVE